MLLRRSVFQALSFSWHPKATQRAITGKVDDELPAMLARNKLAKRGWFPEQSGRTEKTCVRRTQFQRI